MFSCPTTPETQRPRLKPSKSTGWSWPRLVTVPEAQRATAARTRGASVPNEDKAPNAMNQKTSSLPPIEDSDVAGSTGRSAPISPIETQGGRRVTYAASIVKLNPDFRTFFSSVRTIPTSGWRAVMLHLINQQLARYSSTIIKRKAGD